MPKWPEKFFCRYPVECLLETTFITRVPQYPAPLAEHYKYFARIVFDLALGNIIIHRFLQAEKSIFLYDILARPCASA